MFQKATRRLRQIKGGETHLTQSSLTGIIRLRINPIVLLVIELRKKREIDKPPSISERSLGGANNWAILLLARANKQPRILGRDECNCGIRLTERTIIPRFLVSILNTPRVDRRNALREVNSLHCRSHLILA